MKITAEFNSTEELLSFIKTFGTNGAQIVEPKQGEPTPVETPKETKKESKKEATKAPKTSEELPKEEPKQEEPNEQAPSAEKEEPKVTMEMVRAVFTKLIKAGKQKEAKDITSKYGASKLPDLKEEHYAAALKDAEELL
ncbi:hypothetical protein SAMN05444401_1755 [Clostridium amylolyticum]|uniref:Uncharacterized protein n=1 Tax=Clostridium amylolyticum TaxID=1121298 RepID=A0A1M6EZR2_9CLOT|nr:hypothetical protein [Clostridium amylolyticum]SHI90958.1 hypothetical protein SAMN05444401_1755 [Clostridium amylolyticum]